MTTPAQVLLDLWGQPTAGMPAMTADTTGYTLGTQFSVTASVPCVGVRFRSPPSVAAANVPTAIGVYRVTSASAGTLVASRTALTQASWSGPGGSGWITCLLAAPVQLEPGNQYVACVLRPTGANWYGSTANYWTGANPGGAGLVVPPLVAPNNAGAFGGQGRYSSTTGATTLSIPNSSFNATNYWVTPLLDVTPETPPEPVPVPRAWDGASWRAGALKGWTGEPAPPGGEAGPGYPVQAFASAAVGFDAEISVQTAAGSLTPATTAASVPPGTQCVVSFTWDDGVSSNPSEAALLAARGWRGTFYIQTGVVGTSGFVTWQQVRDLEAAGHEIGSHCVDHVYLDTTGDPQGQLTNSRNALLSNGVAAPDSIAYPYYVTDRAIVGMAAQAGYTSGRRAGGGTEAMPPRDGTNFELRAYDVVQTDPARWRTIVTDAEAAPGVPWVIFILHRLGPGVNIGNNQADQATVTAFWDWLALRSPATIVRPVSAQIVPAAHTARFTSHRWTQSSDINSFPPSADTAGWTFGKEFTVGSAAMLTGYQFAVSTGFTAVQESGVEYALFRVTGAGAGELVAGSRVRSGWIVRGTQGTTVVWNRTPLPGGLALTPGQRYKAAVYWAGGAPWYTLIPGPYWAPPGWGGSGLARGPLSILSAAASTDGQHTRVAAGAPPPPSGEWRLVKAWDGDEWAELAP